MTNRFLDLCVPGVAILKPYIPGKPVSELEREMGISNTIKLASNENPLGPPKAAKAIIHGQLDGLALYPDGSGFTLTNALAEKHNLASSSITLGNGSNDVLDMIGRTFLEAGKEAIFSEYAFAVYPIVTQAVGATAQIARAKDYGHDLDAMLKLVNDNTRVIFIANPNNPTGTWLSKDALQGFLSEVPQHIIVVIDEAYIEYVQKDEYPDATQWLSEYDNLIVTRTFSKAYGLAALRVGYCLSHPDVANLLNRVRQPFNVNSLAQSAALAALDDYAHIRLSVEYNTQGLFQYEAAFAEMGLEWIPSVGNFITVDLGRNASEVDKAMLSKGVITRPVANYGLPDHLRITVGLPEENERCIAALKEVLAS
jgi:histidinol-phosphate aminotransferase